MVITRLYWRAHRQVDLYLSSLTTIALWIVGYMYPNKALFIYNSYMMQDLAQKWLGSSLTLFGLLCATNAFMFTVVERVEFEKLRKSKAQAQMWEIMSGGIVTIALASLWVFLNVLLPRTLLNNYFAALVTTFVVISVVFALAKFTWLMAQILSVRAAQARH